MIIEALLSVLYTVFSALTSFIDIPSMPPEVAAVFQDFLQWLQVGLSILASYTHLSYLLVLFGIVMAVDIGISIYHFVMWVLKKIPILNIK